MDEGGWRISDVRERSEKSQKYVVNIEYVDFEVVKL